MSFGKTVKQFPNTVLQPKPDIAEALVRRMDASSVSIPSSNAWTDSAWKTG
jgi:hypothetical protein